MRLAPELLSQWHKIPSNTECLARCHSQRLPITAFGNGLALSLAGRAALGTLGVLQTRRLNHPQPQPTQRLSIGACGGLAEPRSSLATCAVEKFVDREPFALALLLLPWRFLSTVKPLLKSCVFYVETFVDRETFAQILCFLCGDFCRPGNLCSNLAFSTWRCCAVEIFAQCDL